MRITLALLLSLLAGCGALTDFHSARTLEPGATEVGVEGSYFGVVDGGEIGGIPSGAITSRHGVSEGFELGLRMGTMGAEVTGKWRLSDADIVIAAAPTAGGFIVGPEDWWAGIRAPLLIEVPFGEGHGLVFSPRVQAQYLSTSGFFGGGGTGFLANAGLGIGLSLRLGPIALVPEVAAVYPLTAINTDGEAADGVSDDGSVVLLVQGGLGLRWHFSE